MPHFQTVQTHFFFGANAGIFENRFVTMTANDTAQSVPDIGKGRMVDHRLAGGYVYAQQSHTPTRVDEIC
jgi:hypothetical protein